MIGQLVILGISSGAIYALLAGGLVLVFNVTRIVNFMHGHWVIIGALTYWSLMESMGTLPAIVTATLITCIIGGLVYRFVIGWVAGASFVSQVILTIALAFFTEGIALVIWGKEPRSAPPFSSGEPIAVFGALISQQSLWVLGTMIVALASIWVFLNYTLIGKAMNACAVNRMAARVVGIRPDYMGVVSFGMSGLLGAIAGCTYLPLQAMSYNSGMAYTLKAFIAAIIGGMGSFGGAVLGGFALGIAESLGAGLIASGYKDTIGFLAMTAIIFYRVMRMSTK
jgi:branched-chain amino acid transport system permease protein